MLGQRLLNEAVKAESIIFAFRQRVTRFSLLTEAAQGLVALDRIIVSHGCARFGTFNI